MVSGIVQSMAQGASNSVGLRGSAIMVVAMATVIGAAWGILQLFLMTSAVYLVGRWTGGAATFGRVRAALGWAAAPQSVTFAIWLAATVFAGRDLYVDPQYWRSDQIGVAFVAMVVWLATIASVVWWLVLSVIAIAAAQDISVWKATGTWIIAVLMLAVTLVLIGTVVLAFTAR